METLLAQTEAIRAAAELLRSMGAAEVYVFGSAAHGLAHSGSDFDLAVKGLPPDQYFLAVSRASSLMGRSVDLVDLDDDTPLVCHLRASGALTLVA